MEQEHHLAFGPFRLDGTQGRLWQGDQAIALRPQSLAMLRYLVAHPGRLVTKAELRQHVWAGTHVTRYGAAGVCARDSPGVGRCGGRAAVSRHGRPAGLSVSPGRRPGGPAPADDRPPRGTPGRSRGLRAVASSGRPRAPASSSCSVAKPGLARRPWWRWCWPAWTRAVGCGSRGASAPSTMARGNRTSPSWRRWGSSAAGHGTAEVLAVLRRYAPLWLVQLLGVLSEAELERLQRQVQGATAARMLRELAEALDVLTADVPLVLVLEDLQWSDPSTVEALAYLAQRRAPARLLVLGTYRPVEMALRAHPCARHPPGAVWAGAGGGRAAGTPARRGGDGVCDRAPGGAGRRPPRGARLRAHGGQCAVPGEHRGAPGAAGAGGPARGAVDAAGRGRGPGGAVCPRGCGSCSCGASRRCRPRCGRVLEAASVVGKAFAVAAVAAGSQVPGGGRRGGV